VRLSDVSVAGTAPAAAMDMDVNDEAEATGAGATTKGAETEALAARVAELEGKMTTLKRVLMAYQRLTSLCVSLEQAPKAKKGADRVSTLRCTAVNHVHKKALEFQVRALLLLGLVDCWSSSKPRAVPPAIVFFRLPLR
jgi:hypothetical protein